MRRFRGGLAVCIVIGLVNAFAWSVINPVGQGPDELPHAGMVAYVATHHDYPGAVEEQAPGDEYSELYRGLPFTVQGQPTWSSRHERLVRDRLLAAERGGYPPRYVINNPPLYYVLAALPTAWLEDRDLVDRIWVMRAVSVLLMGFLVAFCFLFAREVFPRHPWAWTLSGLAVALHPMIAFMGGSVSPDNALYPAAAALFYFTARTFRRGLTVRRAVGLGLAALSGCLAKGTMFGLLPGVVLGVLWVAWRQRSLGLRSVAIPIVSGAAVFAVPFAIWLWANTAVFDRSGSTTTSGVDQAAQQEPFFGLIKGVLTYTWQHFLPRLPFMHDHFPETLPPAAPGLAAFPAFPQYPLWQIWVEGFVGRFSYSVYSFPVWTKVATAAIYLAVGFLAALAVWRVVGTVHGRRAELATYFAIAAGNFMLVVFNGYLYRRNMYSANFEQARYLFPLIPLYGVTVAAACMKFSRMRPGIALALVVLAAGHAVGGLLLTLDRYYAG